MLLRLNRISVEPEIPRGQQSVMLRSIVAVCMVIQRRDLYVRNYLRAGTVQELRDIFHGRCSRRACESSQERIKNLSRRLRLRNFNLAKIILGRFFLIISTKKSISFI